MVASTKPRLQHIQTSLDCVTEMRDLDARDIQQELYRPRVEPARFVFVGTVKVQSGDAGEYRIHAVDIAWQLVVECSLDMEADPLVVFSILGTAKRAISFGALMHCAPESCGVRNNR
jgi:hypothetical protein